jgi:long-chain acyl-CoA synthetase
VTEHLTFEQAVAELTRQDGEFPIAEKSIRGVPHLVFRDLHENLHDYYKAGVKEFGDREFIVYDSVRLTYREAYAQAAAIGDQLVHRFGIEKGDRVAIGARNYPEWIIAFLAVTSIGAISVSLNGWWTGEELEYGLQEVGARLVFLDRQRWERLADRLPRLGIQPVGIHWDGELPDGVISFDDLLRDGGGQPMPEVEMTADDDTTILFTSGTTGFPKGAVGTHRGILTTMASWAYLGRIRELRGIIPTPDPDEAPEFLPAFLMPLPLFHVSGCHAGLLASFMSGRKIVMMYKWKPEEALRLVEEERITEFNGVPTMTWELLESPDLSKRDLSSLNFLSGGGAPMPGGMIDQVIERLPGKQFSLGWGMTETSAGGLNIPVEDLQERPASCGRWCPVCEVKIVDDNGNELPRGEDGELVFKSPMNIRCYWNRPEATAEAIVDGWLHTGDIARIDDDDFVYIVDRKKDMVLRGGENIYCAEVERVIYQHDAVYEAAVFGLPDKRLGEELAAVVMFKPGRQISKDELCKHVANHLAAFKVPAVVQFRDEQLPRGATDKIHKRSLREQVLKELGKGE